MTSGRLRVVYLDHCAQLSGAELAMARLLPALAEDVDAHVVLGEDGPLVARLEAAGISTEVLPMAEAARGLSRDRVRPGRLPGASMGHTAHYVATVARRLRRLRPDLVHTNSLKANVYGSVAGNLARVPVVWHARERLADDYLPPAAIRMVRAMVRHLPAAVIANSDSTREGLDSPGVAITVIPSPVHVEAVARSRPPGSPLRVGMVGRLAPSKGQHVFLDAFAAAFPEGPEQAVVVGGALFGEASYEEALGQQVARLGLADRVELTGFREDVSADLAGLDVLVHASLITEGFGQVVVEGMAAGLAVVAAAAGGPLELITDGSDGLLYPTGDVETLAGTLRRLAADPGLREQLGEAARRRARNFTPEVVAAQVLEVYRATTRR
ncbi:MAG: glycosyltransferase family 4 protein [Actinobacteria bacterium]|nr:glycosyltransferase family 4 protein [Actinomycetota bacterium]